MFEVGDELIGIEGNPYYYTGIGERVIVLSVREKEKEPALISQYAYGSGDLIVVLVEELNNQNTQVSRKAIIDYLKQDNRREFSYRYENISEYYIVYSNHFKLYRKIKQKLKMNMLIYLKQWLLEKKN